MGDKIRKSPNIRFAGFTDDWEERKLGELAIFSKGQNYSKNDLIEDGTPIILYGRLYTKYQTLISDVDTFAIEKPKSIYSSGKEVIVPASGETSEDIARASAVAKSGILLGGDLNIIYPNENIEPSFLALSISNGEQQKSLAKKAQGKSVVHLRNTDLEELIFSYPSYKEQLRIRSLFLETDNLITLHQRKLDLLKATKKSMLQKMFPKNGESVPEIRFAGFTGDWEERKLSNVAQIVGGGTPNTANQDYWDGDIDWYAPAEINDKIFVDGSERKITELGLQKSAAKILPAYKTVLFTSRAGIGKMAILRKEAATNQGFQSMILNDNINPYFVYSMGNIIKDKAEKVASGSTFAEISGKMLGNLMFMFPTSEEQKKIGEYFKNLDNLITLHQRELDLLKDLKKSMLKQMFI